MARTVIVTGAASGIGHGVARRFARDGHRVAMVDRSADALQAASDALNADGCTTIACAADISNRAEVEAAVAAARSAFGPIEVAIPCAGVSEFVPFLDLTLDQWQRIIDINLTGMFHTLQLVMPDMLAAKWGRIITISSMSAQVGGPNMAHYSASKGGVTSLTKALSRDFAGQGITVNTIPPSIIEGGMTRSHQLPDGSNPMIDAMVAQVPVGRIGTPDDIAACCAWLASDDAGFVTGQEINVNGGMYV